MLTVRSLGKGRVAYLASASFPYPDEDGMVPWLMKKLGLGPMLAVSGDARDRHLVFSLRRRERQQLVLHVSDLTTFAGGKRIEPNSSHEIDPVQPIPEIVLQLPLETKPNAVKVVPATTRVEWEYQNDMLRLVLRDFQTARGSVAGDHDAGKASTPVAGHSRSHRRERTKRTR